MRVGVTGVSGKSPSKLRVNERMLLKSGAWLEHQKRGCWMVKVDGSNFYSSFIFEDPTPPWRHNQRRVRVFKAWRSGGSGAALVFRTFREALADAESAAMAKAAVGRLMGPREEL